jgi:uncharacterized protein YegP (UPF0339 family)
MKFEIFKSDKNGEFYFRLKAGNGEIILSSEGYKSKASCKSGIESVMKNCQEESRFDRKQAANGKWHFSLKSGNGQVIGTSQMYATEAGMNNGIAAVGKAEDAGIDDQAD